MYYIMNKQFAKPLLDIHPYAAEYDNRKLVLTGDKPDNFTGTIIDLASKGFNENNDINSIGLTPTELTALVDKMLTSKPTGKLVQISKPQGLYLYNNHTAFMPKETI